MTYLANSAVPVPVALGWRWRRRGRPDCAFEISLERLPTLPFFSYRNLTVADQMLVAARRLHASRVATDSW